MEDGRAARRSLFEEDRPFGDPRGLERLWHRQVSVGTEGEQVSRPPKVDRGRQLHVEEASGRKLFGGPSERPIDT